MDDTHRYLKELELLEVDGLDTLSHDFMIRIREKFPEKENLPEVQAAHSVLHWTMSQISTVPVEAEELLLQLGSDPEISPESESKFWEDYHDAVGRVQRFRKTLTDPLPANEEELKKLKDRWEAYGFAIKIAIKGCRSSLSEQNSPKDHRQRLENVASARVAATNRSPIENVDSQLTKSKTEGSSISEGDSSSTKDLSSTRPNSQLYSPKDWELPEIKVRKPNMAVETAMIVLAMVFAPLFVAIPMWWNLQANPLTSRAATPATEQQVELKPPTPEAEQKFLSRTRASNLYVDEKDSAITGRALQVCKNLQSGRSLTEESNFLRETQGANLSKAAAFSSFVTDSSRTYCPEATSLTSPKVGLPKISSMAQWSLPVVAIFGFLLNVLQTPLFRYSALITGVIGAAWAVIGFGNAFVGIGIGVAMGLAVWGFSSLIRWLSPEFTD